MKRLDIYLANPNVSTDCPKFVSYYIDMHKCGPMFLGALSKIKNEIDSSPLAAEKWLFAAHVL
jgi:succinate dehydrogenase/fumarate reductase-like Fe-S protein